MKKIFKLSLFVLLSLFITVSLASCTKEEEETVDKYASYYDTITKSLKLNFDYENKKFLTEGASIATVDDYTDGDTIDFITDDNEAVTIRFYEVDTPESTSSVDKWGKAASKFTKSKLSNATQIVLEATKSQAVHDSYGVRYLGYVWYKTETDDFKCLNLELVENGFSDYSGADTSDHPYYYYFNKAKNFASEAELRVYGDDDDPMYVTEITETSIKDIVNDKANSYSNYFIDTERDIGKRVTFNAYIKNVTTYSKNNDGSNVQYTFTVAQYDATENKEYTLSLYAGYGSKSASKELRVGEYYKICGFIELRYNKIQLKGVEVVDADARYKPDGSSYYLRGNYVCSFNTDDEFDIFFEPTYYTNATVVSKEVSGSDLLITVKTKKIEYNPITEEFETNPTEISLVLKVIGGASYSSYITADKTIKTIGDNKGLQIEEGTVTILKYSDLTIS